jgi:ATP-dependent Clp protease ATP-binding subunit ClpB
MAMKIGANLQDIKQEIDRALDSLPRQTGAGPGGGSMSNTLRDILNDAWNQAVKLQDQYLSTEHMILSLASKESDRSKQILNASGFTKENILRCSWTSGRQARHKRKAEEQYEALEKYGRDLTKWRA